ncbi:transporter [Rosenbergiella collisarenosi]|uniref:transporter n=1 Tax=Rosenbergiella collisarenosi TaxID=1544695 RepID=UPI001F503951|nr:transporter [Rosenbergiella collisarenosi]
MALNCTKIMLIMGVLFVSQPVRAIDFDAGDYTAMPAGTNLGLLYYTHANSGEYINQGHTTKRDTSLKQDVSVLRMIHFTTLGGYTIDPQFLLPFGRVRGRLGGSDMGNASGVGDLILASTLWLYNNPTTQTYFGVTPFLYVPTGRYSHQDSLNMGENRWKYALQAAFSTPLYDRLLLDVGIDATRFGDNNDYGSASSRLSQNTLYQGQVHLRYLLTPAFDIRTSYTKDWGGHSSVDGVSQGKPGEDKYSVGAAYLFASKTQLLGTWGRDTSMDTGFKSESVVKLRLMQMF